MNRATREIVAACLLLVSFLATPAWAGKQLVIVKSSDNSYFNQTIETLVSRTDQANGHRILTADQLAAEVDPANENLLLIGLGQAAIEAIQQLGSQAPSVSAYITLEQHRKLGIAGQPSVLLDQPLNRYLAFTAMLPGVDSVGIIVEEKVEINRPSSDWLDKIGLDLRQYATDENNKLLPVLRRLLQREDALLMLPRANIYNRDSLKGVLLTSYRSRKPVISYSPAHVKSGALASIYSSPRDIGLHLALLVNQMLADPDYQPPAYQFARYYSVTTNPRVARALGISLPEESELRLGLDEIEP